MRFGLAIMNDFPPGTAPAGRLAEMRDQVAAARDAGFDSIWMLQHYLGNMPTLQPLPTLAAMSSDAGDMRLGTNMLILPLHHPVEVAEAFATLDHLSGGRAAAGFGLGYRENEFRAFGVDLADRLARYEEALTIIRQLWTGEPTTFRGKHFTIDGEAISLAPVQPGGPDIWVGAGAHRAGARRAARLGDGWIMPPHVPLDRLRRLRETFLQEAARVGGGRPRRLAVRRELLLDHDEQRARQLGTAARTALSRRYGAFNPPDHTATYRHLQDDRSAAAVADESYLFTDPPRAVERLTELAGVGVTDVIVRMQWYDLPHEQVMRTMQLFRTEVMPLVAGPVDAVRDGAGGGL